MIFPLSPNQFRYEFWRLPWTNVLQVGFGCMTNGKNHFALDSIISHRNVLGQRRTADTHTHATRTFQQQFMNGQMKWNEWMKELNDWIEWIKGKRPFNRIHYAKGRQGGSVLRFCCSNQYRHLSIQYRGTKHTHTHAAQTHIFAEYSWVFF